MPTANDRPTDEPDGEAGPAGERIISGRITVGAAPETVFALLADPRAHSVFDGSGTVREHVSGPERLELGSRFGMSMKMGVPYRMRNTVVEFEQDRHIAWRHIGGHRWRYELEPTGDGRTLVTESFDWSTAKLAALYGRSIPARNARSIERTLKRLRAVLTTEDSVSE